LVLYHAPIDCPGILVRPRVTRWVFTECFSVTWRSDALSRYND